MARRLVHTFPSVLAVLGGLLFLLAPPAAALDYKSMYERIGAHGVAIIEFTDEGIVGEHYFGTDGDGAQINRDTLTPWGSISASVTAATTLQLASDGLLDLSAPISTYLPQLRGSALDQNRTTVLDLIHHTSGLPANLETGEHSTAGVVAAAAKLTELPHAGTHSYSNVGYSLLQAIIQEISAAPIDATINNTVSTVSGTGPLIADTKSFRKRVPHGYQPLFHTSIPVTVDPWESAIGAAFVAGSNEQLATYAAWQLRQHRAHLSPGDLPRTKVSDVLSYGAGLYYETMQRRRGKEIEFVFHTGSTWGYSSYLGFTPEDNRGLLILTNEFGLRTQYDQQRRSNIRTFIHDYFHFAHVDPPSMFPTDIVVLAVEALIAAALAAAIVRSCLKWRHPNPPADARAAFRRTTIPLLLGTGAALAVYYGLPLATSYEGYQLHIGAPDISALFWAILVEIHVLTGVVVLREITWARATQPGTLPQARLGTGQRRRET
ncbi:serine hydrolase [Corynebacterium sp.]|uniref:serine hydrolase domain-containing protein n=1 Tax=Corynebacterium sp. TaxID=1720 RepID=UPI0026DC8952|nr:serine hydrolase domain-containing protein [Corynebacterium sp.]MDO5076379.1 serine hydrolase domain-containing protein [Corynebacterium sp.]